jgi:hypothetical protein
MTIPMTATGKASSRLLRPHAPMRQALVLGAIGFALSVAGAIAMRDFGPNWYPVALVLTTLPFAWLSGAQHRRRHPEP